MTGSATYSLQALIERLKKTSPGETEFHQAVKEVYCYIIDIANDDPRMHRDALLERLMEPDRIISFRVAWEDDHGQLRVNRGYRVQHSNILGPYKGGLRFHPSVNPSILKFLAFEQTFKNALTSLPMGGGKGGSDFDPRNHSEREINRFCIAFMTELHRHIAPDIDVPAGDINVGAREIGYMFGAYRRLTNEFEGVLTGKEIVYGGSELRVEATGFGLVYFVRQMLEFADDGLTRKTVVISGSGNVATHAAEKAQDLGAKVVTLSDSQGFIHDPDGIDPEKLRWIRRHKSKPDTSLEAYAEAFDATWHAGKAPWGVKCDIALPCATQNELDAESAADLIDNGCRLIAEGANMPLTPEAIEAVRSAGIRFAPAKAANAGGVAVSGLEISQNRASAPRKREEISDALQDIMRHIHDTCAEAGKTGDTIDYAKGANVAAFRRVASAMLGQGIA